MTYISLFSDFAVHLSVSPTVSNRKASYFGYFVRYDTVNDLILFVDHCDLYFMVK